MITEDGRMVLKDEDENIRIEKTPDGKVIMKDEGGIWIIEPGADLPKEVCAYEIGEPDDEGEVVHGVTPNHDMLLDLGKLFAKMNWGGIKDVELGDI